MNCKGKIVSNPEILGGKPIIEGTRISVDLILGWVTNGWSVEEILDAYPHIGRRDLEAALAFAAEPPQSDGSLDS